MGNQGDDRYGGDGRRDRGRSHGFGGDRDFRNMDRDQGRGWNEGRREASGWGPGLGGGDRGGDGRGFFERAGEEVRSWFGGDEGDRDRYDRGPSSRRDNGYRGGGRDDDDHGSGGSYGYMSHGWGNQSGESWNRDRPGERGWGDESERGREREPERSGGGRGWFTESIGGERGNRRGASGPGWNEAGGMSGMNEAERSRGAQLHDPHYAQWRRRQMEELDRDYEEYRREHQSKFEQEFGTWRSQRQGQRQKLGSVTEQMEVVGSDGTLLGTVDTVRGDRIILAKGDDASGAVRHSIPCSWVETTEGKVTLNRTADQARTEWRNEENSRALFEREDQGSEGPHMLNRSFSGTYRDRDD